ncbi:hypothetical protein D3874_03085 [Oleomonas cavernae]|uniref:Mu-like prophage FluMu protein gp28 n=2 Tax=Oleomonas cavernae TaxID=2320859 RepID=A0A418WUN7_9PROT|nr:hypothetical protein D3874_03085 [Oleomonas cavernae]
MLVGKSLPDVLLPKQQELLRSTATNALVVSDKSRRVGFTWAVGADAVLTAGAQRAAGGMDVLYIGYNLDMAREFIDTCAMWAKAFMPGITEVGEFLFQDVDSHGDPRTIQAFRIGFASGYEIVALSSRPRSLRGRQGYVILDEFAFHDDAAALLKAAMALLIWGGKVLVISTHNGVDNPFNELINEIRAGKRPGAVVRCTFDDAIEQGLYQRVCLTRGIEWSPEGEAKWRAEIYKSYGADADEELRCIPSQGSGVVLTRAQIEACMVPGLPVLRLECPPGFEMQTREAREAFAAAWIADHLAPLVETLDPRWRYSVGQDFARSGAVSVIVPLAVMQALRRHAPFVIEMRNVPFDQQRQILWWLIDHLPRRGAVKLDATGNGAHLGELTAQKYGYSIVEPVHMTEAWYLENMPRMVAGVADRDVDLPADADHIDDLRQIKLVKGTPRVPEVTHKGSDGKGRHGDFAVALALAWAATVANVVDGDVLPIGAPRASAEMLDATFGAADRPGLPRGDAFGEYGLRADFDYLR